MPSAAKTVSDLLYGQDVWANFEPWENSGEVQGWNGNHPSLSRLAALASGKAPIVIDVGVWKGQSTITLANAMRRANIDGCVIAVDTFLGSIEHWSGPIADFKRQNGHPDLYKAFLNNVAKHELTDFIVPMPQTATAAAAILKAVGIEASIAHIDAAHEYEDVLRDAHAYWDLLRPSGYLIGDDYDQTWPGVVQAAGEFSAKVCKPLTIEAPKWILRK